MTRPATEDLIARYYSAFNAGDAAGMLALLTEDVEHRVNEGTTRSGKENFIGFCSHMGVSYRETLRDIMIFATADGARAAAEFTVHGIYLQTDPGLPAARGQAYVLPAGAFFDIRDGRIARITTFYNLADWVRQVSE